MKLHKLILLQLILFSSLFAEDKFLSIETIFSRYLISNNIDIAKSIAKSNDSIYASYCKADLTEDTQEKIKLFSEFIKRKPKLGLAQAYLKRGMSYRELEKLDSALADFDLSESLDPKEPYLYYFRGEILFSSSKYEDAIKNFNKTIELDKKLIPAYNLRGNSYYEMGKFQEALKDFNKSIEINSDNEQAYFLRGMTYYGLAQYDKALQDMEYVKKVGANFAKYADSQITKIKEKLKEK